MYKLEYITDDVISCFSVTVAIVNQPRMSIKIDLVIVQTYLRGMKLG